MDKGPAQVADTCDASDLCYELSGGKETEYCRRYGDTAPNRVLEDVGRHTLLADIAPMVVGHSLFVPKHHYISFGHVARDHAEFEADFAAIAEQYEKVYGEFAFLEHGSSSNLRSSACIVHAHIHLVPLCADRLMDIMTDAGIALTRVGGWQDAVALAQSDQSYYAVGSRSISYLALTPATYLPKHFARIVLARSIGIDEGRADWAVNYDLDKLNRTIRLWADASANLESGRSGQLAHEYTPAPKGTSNGME